MSDDLKAFLDQHLVIVPVGASKPRPIMTRAELAKHQIDAHGRDYSRSDDGYDDMELAISEGWSAISGWGRDGWDLGDWPYVVISVRNVGVTDIVKDNERCTSASRYQMRQTVEGDTTVYDFASKADRDAAIDCLFVWYGFGQDYDSWAIEGLTSDKREALDAGTLRVPAQFRGPFSWKRAEEESSVNV